MNSFRFDGWVPIRIYWLPQSPEPFVDWCYLGSERFSEPFFDLTIQNALDSPFNTLFRHQTPMSALGDWQQTSPGLKPSGFIFHMTRCGSTLVTQLLASQRRNIVLSEPSPLDALARCHWRTPSTSVERRVAWLQWMVSALGQRRTGEEENYYIKFDGRTIFEFPLIRRAFPDVPWIFMLRNPVEVVVSNLREPGALTTQGLFGQDFLRIPPEEIQTMKEEEYTARVIGRICEAACDYLPQGGIAVNYSDLPGAVWGKIAGHFGLVFADEEIEEMQKLAGFDGKRPSTKFVADSDAKQSAASEEILALCSRWIDPPIKRILQAD